VADDLRREAVAGVAGNSGRCHLARLPGSTPAHKPASRQVDGAVAHGVIPARGPAPHAQAWASRPALSNHQRCCVWDIENHAHYVRDVTLGEDASRIRTRPGIMARIRSVALNILHANGIQNISMALYANAVSFDHLLALGMA